MVCLGNICRSPLAEGILRHKLSENNIFDIEVDSAGTSNFHIGQSPDKRTQENAFTHKVDLSKLKARQFIQEDFDRFDKIYVMDSSNYQNVLALSKNDEDMAKVEFLLNELNPGLNQDVPDPYYGGSQGFENVFQLVDKACQKIIEQINE